MWRQRFGRAGEALAERHLVERGCVVIARRHRCRAGEVDLVVRDGEVLAFVEVKARRGRRYGSPLEAVTPRKVRRLRAAAADFLRRHRYPRTRVRFDVVGVEGRAGRARVRWYKDAL